MDNNILTSEQISLKNGLCTCDKAYKLRGLSAPDCPWHSLAVEEAMEEYKDLHTAPLREELEKLRAENERLKNSFDEVFNQRNSIQSNNERLEDENEQFRKLYMDALDHRAKLRELLLGFVEKIERGEKIGVNLLTTGGVEYEIAKEALKGGSDET